MEILCLYSGLEIAKNKCDYKLARKSKYNALETYRKIKVNIHCF